MLAPVGTYGLEPRDQDALRAAATSAPAWSPEYAGWWVRVGAYLIDVALLLLSLFVVAVIGALISDSVAIALVVLWLILGWLGYWVYYEGSESGQTIGKKIVHIRVRDAAGGRAGYGKAFGRNLVARFIGIIPLVGVIDVLWPIWDREKQCLHDKAASTIVVRD
jgi:uncharacterized RDD family membrane protein YckC